jgi:hypothetical protein
MSAALALGGVALVAGATLLSAAPASAASIDTADPIFKVSILQPSTSIDGQLTTAIQWCAPAAAKPGDTFTLQLDPKLKDLPTSFPLEDPSGKTVAQAVISTGTPAVITFTLTSYLDTHHDTCGTADVTADIDGQAVTLGQQNPFTFTTGDGKSFTSEVTVTGNAQGDPNYPAKYPQWSSADQGRTNPTDAIDWFITTPQGVFTSATVNDPVPAGQAWRWDCTNVSLQSGSLDSKGDWAEDSVVSTTGPNAPTVRCTPTDLSVTWPAQVAGKMYRVGVASSLPAATGPTTTNTYSNVARVTTLDGTTPIGTWSLPASIKQASAVGAGVGVVNTATSVPTTPAATPTTTPAVAAAPTTGSRELAYTGSNSVPALTIGGALLLLGGVAAGAARLRGRKSRI